ncbi:phosphonate C-P lyase system protein PhnG [Alkalimonas sp. MEB108]|uniref:Phosphonate C-P lyase system protein PhnG n=1 Tax=Alkalimonas cellulosilytica TaxID=3058395 RepID=A0ABU7J6R1_9GAMM|nr:phosphonate C-P lyase system protein PhnG [Alkalimonas sp. MEB108]MEE2002104.1 phosphonate C-P lyase system protein PhnG [Alkalimonas sp. MEB108]
MTTQADNYQPSHPRHQWCRLMQALPSNEVITVANQCGAAYQVEDLQLPESGLALLKTRDSAMGDDYFLGEIPVARAHVRLIHQGHVVAEGAAQLLNDQTNLARSMAILDAILSQQLPGYQAAAKLLDAGAVILKGESEKRRAMLSSTLVDFSLLGNEEDEHHA